MSACEILRQAVLNKTAALSGGAPTTNAPKQPEHPGHPGTNAPGQKKSAGVVVNWLRKTAGQRKVAARRPGRLDGDETLDKLAAKRSSRSRK